MKIKLLLDLFNPEPIPDGVVLAPHHFYIGVMMATFGFLFVWRLYPRTGATLSLVGLLIALDDVVEHTFGIRTPLDVIGRVIVLPLLRLIENV